MRNWKMIAVLLLCFSLLGFWRYNELQQSLINSEDLGSLEDADAGEILAALFTETASIKTQTIKVQTKITGGPETTFEGLVGKSVVKMKQPNKVRVETAGPIVGSDGTNLWFYWPGDNKCNILTFEELADTGFDLREMYDPNTMAIQLQKEYMFEAVDKGKQWELTGMSLDGTRCTIQVGKKPVRLLSLNLDFSASYKIETSFSYKNENKKFPDTLFSPPPAAEIVADCPLSWLLLAESMEAQQDLEAAARLMGKGAEIAAAEDVYGLLLAQAKYLDRLERYEEARICYQKSLEHAPAGGAKSAVHFYIGMLEFRLGSYEDAVEHYHEMLRECPEAIDGWLVKEYLGYSYGYLGDFEKAREVFVKALEKAPTDQDKKRIKHYLGQIDNG